MIRWSRQRCQETENEEESQTEFLGRQAIAGAAALRCRRPQGLAGLAEELAEPAEEEHVRPPEVDDEDAARIRRRRAPDRRSRKDLQ